MNSIVKVHMKGKIQNELMIKIRDEKKKIRPEDFEWSVNFKLETKFYF